MFFSSTVIVALVAALAPVTNAFLDMKKMTFEPFEAMRPKINFPSYTPEQRQTVADQADAILSIYVNRESKISNYGVDPIPTMKDIKKRAKKMSDSEFHLAMASLFLSLRDFHTNYQLPSPYNCYRALYPLSFELVDSRDILNEPVVAVKSFTHPEALKFAEGIKDQVSIGDILVSYNGKSFKELYEENKHFTGGANEYGGMRSILNIMSFRPGSMYPLPEENEVTYVLKKGLHSRETYTITAPIVGISHDACVFIDMLGLNDMDEDGEDDQTEEGFERKRAESSGIFNSIYRGPYHAKDHTVDTEFNARMDVDEPMTATGAVTHDIEMSASDDDTMSIDSDSDMDVDATAEEAARQRKRVKLAKRHLNEGGVNKHPYLDELKFQYNPNDDYEMKETDEPIISWSIYERRPTKMGIIRLESFMPEADQSGMMSLEIIRSLLTNELADTDALIFDIRDNGGGLIVMADLIPQFFTPNLDTSAARALVAPVNKQIFMDKMPNSSWAEAYSRVKRTDKYTPLVKFFDPNQAKEYGQVYFKPVAVFNNGNCYSACELFSANMQDSRAAVVFGEDPQTGGGGANVVPHRGFFTNILPEVFTKMPHNQDMRIGWRQSVRFGVNNGKLIDDTGVIADHVVRPRPDDLLPNRTTFSQMQFITWKLGVEGRTDGRKYMTFLTEPDLRGDLEIGAPVEFGYKMSWFDKLELFDSDNNMIGKTTTQLSKTPKTGTLTSSASATNAGAAKYSIVGYSMGNKIFTTYRHIRFTPRKSDYLTISANTTEVWDFSTNKYAALYNTGSPEEQGWNLRDGAMVIHDGVSYLDETDSGITFFCNFEEGTKPTVHIKAEFDTELNNDFLLALVYADGMKPHKLFIGSGKGIVDHAFNLKNYVGKSGVELELRFLSDPEVTGGTVKISHVKFEGTGKATRGKAVRTRNGRRRPKKQIE